MTRYATLLAVNIYSDVRQWVEGHCTVSRPSRYVPPEQLETWVVADISVLTTTAIRYWRGDDRDSWHRDIDRAAVFSSERMANIVMTQFMVNDYYPGSQVKMKPP